MLSIISAPFLLLWSSLAAFVFRYVTRRGLGLMLMCYVKSSVSSITHYRKEKVASLDHDNKKGALKMDNNIGMTQNNERDKII
jgi:hypothetical protein